MFRLGFRILLVLLLLFIVPALGHLGVWSLTERPDSWRHAKWTSADILPKTPKATEAQIYVFSARTGGLKGAFASHTWLVLKPKGATRFDRYDVVGWGRPVRKNAYEADAYWYSNKPEIIHKITGKKAEQLIPKITSAIFEYPWKDHGDYVIWPGPNSNTFVSSVLRQIPEIEASAPSTAVGRDFPADGRWIGRYENGAIFANLGGYFGIVMGGETGLEVNFLGLVAGINVAKKQILIPAFGAIDLGSFVG